MGAIIVGGAAGVGAFVLAEVSGARVVGIGAGALVGVGVGA